MEKRLNARPPYPNKRQKISWGLGTRRPQPVIPLYLLLLVSE